MNPFFPFPPFMAGPFFASPGFQMTGDPTASMAQRTAPGMFGITPEMQEEFRRNFLLSQKEQLTQFKKYLSDYTKYVDESLAAIEKELGKPARKQAAK